MEAFAAYPFLCEGNSPWPVDSLHEWPVMRSIDNPPVASPDKQLNGQEGCRLFDTPWRSRGATVMMKRNKAWPVILFLKIYYIVPGKDGGDPENIYLQEQYLD